jgi:hypothetical protein
VQANNSNFIKELSEEHLQQPNMGRGAPFPRDVADFDTDERISYSTIDGKYILIDDDNEEWEFSEATGKWFQPVSPSTRPIALRC